MTEVQLLALHTKPLKSTKNSILDQIAYKLPTSLTYDSFQQEEEFVPVYSGECMHP